MFITFSDDGPASKKVPWANTFMIFVNVLVAYLTVGHKDFLQVLGQYGFIPARHLGVGLFTGIFLHSSWTQLVANMSFLFFFGKGVEQEWGRVRYLAAYLLLGLSGEAAHAYFHPHSTLALIGASRVVTGMGIIYLLHFPWGRMKWIFSFFGVPLLEVPSRTIFVMGLWALVQAALAFIPWDILPRLMPVLARLNGTVFTVHQTAGTAWDAHLGAMAMGLALFAWFTLLKKKKGRGGR
ncbi:MAG TPA: rhomboid family intramembrane serine protease [bacterium]|nr:rhomboid family intramembrane serine protease [bacterium]